MWARAGAAPLKDALAYGDVCSEQHHLSTRKGASQRLVTQSLPYRGTHTLITQFLPSHKFLE